jgi:hypothetical protein
LLFGKIDLRSRVGRIVSIVRDDVATRQPAIQVREAAAG